MKITVIGTGFVGVVTAGVLASFGNEVVGVDVIPEKVAKLNVGEVPFFEPGLEDLLKSQLGAKLKFTVDYAEAIPGADVVMVAVGTPSAADGNADLTYVFQACESLAPYIKENAVVAIKSTVPPGIFAELQQKIAAKTQTKFSLASLPEFLREGSAVQDTLHPDRVVIGCEDPASIEILKQLHAPFQAPLVIVKPASAQMGKYSANAYLAMRITFANQIADLCETNGADIQEVISVIGKDKRIGDHYWYPGLGYGGSCFPKDVREIAAYSRSIGRQNDLFNKISDINEIRIPEKLEMFGQTIGGWQGKKVAVLGLSFKKNTDDMREAPCLKSIPFLLQNGAEVIGYDPMAIPGAQQFFGEKPGLSFAEDLQQAVTNADVVLLLVEWQQIVEFNYSQLPALENKPRVMIDTRNQLDGQALETAGWQYLSIGRPQRVG